MTLGIKFGGHPLLLEDPDGLVQQWLDQWLPIDDLRAVSGWQHSTWSTWNAPYPNYSQPLRPKINTWYRPVGASRWAFGLFLADTETKNAIIADQTAAGGRLSLAIEHAGAGRSWLAYCLPPRPVSADIGLDSTLWLLPVVDERYYWQFASNTGATLTDTSTWEGLFDSLATVLGITLNVDAISSDYGRPHVGSFNAGNFSNAAVMLDAAAMSVGQRVVLEYLSTGAGNGSYFSEVYRSCSWSTSNSRRGYNNALIGMGAQQYGILAGSDAGLSAVNPSSVKVVFRKWANGIIYDPMEGYTKELPAATFVSSGSMTGRPLTILSTALANFTTGGGAPDNQAAIDALATKIASDFYAGLGWFSDQCRIGIPQYIETGFDDYVEFSVGRRRDDGSYELRTRVHTQPHNFGVQTMLHQVDGTHEYPDTIEGKLDGNLIPGGTATLSVWDAVPVGDSLRNVVVTDRLQWDVPAGAWVVAERIGREWRPIAASCAPV